VTEGKSRDWREKCYVGRGIEGKGPVVTGPKHVFQNLSEQGERKKARGGSGIMEASGAQGDKESTSTCVLTVLREIWSGTTGNGVKGGERGGWLLDSGQTRSWSGPGRGEDSLLGRRNSGPQEEEGPLV